MTQQLLKSLKNVIMNDSTFIGEMYAYYGIRPYSLILIGVNVGEIKGWIKHSIINKVKNNAYQDIDDIACEIKFNNEILDNELCEFLFKSISIDNFEHYFEILKKDFLLDSIEWQKNWDLRMNGYTIEQFINVLFNEYSMNFCITNDSLIERKNKYNTEQTINEFEGLIPLFKKFNNQIMLDKSLELLKYFSEKIKDYFWGYEKNRGKPFSKEEHEERYNNFLDLVDWYVSIPNENIKPITMEERILLHNWEYYENTLDQYIKSGGSKSDLIYILEDHIKSFEESFSNKK